MKNSDFEEKPKAYYLGHIETPSDHLERNREHDRMAERTLQMVLDSREAGFAFFEGDKLTVLVAVTMDSWDRPKTHAEIRSKSEEPISWQDISAVRQQVFDSSDKVIVEALADAFVCGGVAYLRQG